MLWIFAAVLFLLWFVLKFLFHHSGYVHLLLLCGISCFVVQFAAERRTRYQRHPSD